MQIHRIMNTHIIFGGISAAFGLIYIAPFLLAILQKTAKPHFISWLIWTFVMGTTFFAQLFSHAGAGSWNNGIGAIECLAICIYGFLHGEKNITRGDWISLILALTAIPLWIVTRDPFYSVVLVTLIDIVAYYPTIRKSWSKPHDEPAMAYIVGTFAQFFSILAIERFIPTNWIAPIATCAANLTLIFVLILRRRVIPKPIAT